MDTAIFEIKDATVDERFKENALVTGDPNIRFYAGYPLIDPMGYALGTLCVIDRKPKILTANQKRGLQLLGQEVIALIVERRQKEELKNFEKLFKLSNDLVFVGGADGSFKKINPAFEKVLGWGKDYIINTPYFEFVHPDDVESTQKELQKLSEGQPSVNFIQRFKTSSNQYKTLQWTSTPEPLTGNIFGIGRDISEVKIKEQQLFLSESKLRAFFENSQAMMCTHDLQGNFLSANNAGASLLGYTRKESSKLSLLDIIPEAHHSLLTAYLSEINSNGRAQGQIVTRHKNGSFRIWMFNNVLEKNTDGSAYVIGNAIDITENYHLEQDLKRTQEMLEQTNAVARVGGWEFDVERQKIKWTTVMKEIHGVAPDYEPILSSGMNFYKEGENRDKITDAINVAISDGKSWNMELQIINTEGNELWIRALGNSEFENGKCKRLYGTCQDINDYTGKTLKETMDWGWTPVLHPDDLDNCIKIWAESIKTGKPYEVEYRFKRASDGLYKWHLGRAFPMKNEQGEITKWFGFCTDIDEYKRGLYLQNTIIQLEDFNQIVAHNLRGPAGSIQMILSMISESPSENERVELFNMLKQSSITLNETLEELMKILEVRNNKNLLYDKCDLNEVVNKIEGMLKGQIISKHAIISINFETVSIEFPKIYLESIFYNIISNSLKYCKPDTPPEILITSNLIHGKVILTFKDNGLGIDLKKHGEDMFKLNKVFHHGFDSKGVGLFMTKTQIETFGGQITVESEPNVGTKFIISL